jgi:MFS family permease
MVPGLWHDRRMPAESTSSPEAEPATATATVTATATAAPVQTYRALFGIREFRVLFSVRVVVMIGLVISNLAIGTVIFASTGSPLLTALALFGGPLVQLVTSSFLLAGSDLMRPRTAMVVSAVAAGATDLLQLIPGLPWGARFGILALGYVVLAATSGTVIALLSDIVPRESFVLARATLNITVGGMQILGNGVGALLLLVLAGRDLFWFSGIITILGALAARTGLRDHPPRATGSVVARTREVNRRLLSSSLVRPIYLMMWIPNGLVVGCEALYIPYAGHHAGYVFGATSAGMLAGDIVIGRFVPERRRDRLIVPLRVLLAVPFLVFAFHPPLVVAALLGLVAGFGYPAALPLQERLVSHTDEGSRGQVFGLSGTGMMVGQALGATIAGVVADVLGEGSTSVGRAMAIMAVLSLVATSAISPALRRSRPSLGGAGARG